MDVGGDHSEEMDKSHSDTDESIDDNCDSGSNNELIHVVR